MSLSIHQAHRVLLPAGPFGLQRIAVTSVGRSMNSKKFDPLPAVIRSTADNILRAGITAALYYFPISNSALSCTPMGK